MIEDNECKDSGDRNEVTEELSQSCKVCKKPVSNQEIIYMQDKEVIHISCFKCSICDLQLNILEFHQTESGVYYCHTCHKRHESKKKKHKEKHTEPAHPSTRPIRQVRFAPKSPQWMYNTSNPKIRKAAEVSNSRSAEYMREFHMWSKLAKEFVCKHCERTCTTRDKLVKTFGFLYTFPNYERFFFSEKTYHFR